MKDHSAIYEIKAVEKAFEAMAKEMGIATAFQHYTAENAVLNRNNQLIRGKEAIRQYFDEHPDPPGATLEWSPEYVDVSGSDDLAYTFGPYKLGLGLVNVKVY
jgi:ketosteroid isomerase-like protein